MTTTRALTAEANKVSVERQNELPRRDRAVACVAGTLTGLTLIAGRGRLLLI